MKVILTDTDTGSHIDFVDGGWKNPIWAEGHTVGLGEDGIEGWYDSLALRNTDIEPKISGHGGYAPASRSLDSRVVTIHGVHSILRDTAGSIAIGDFLDRLNAMAGQTVEIKVIDESGERTATGVVSAQIPIIRKSWWTREFSIIVTCADDPLKHGQPALYWPESGRVTVENAGTAPAWPVIRASNPDGVSFVSASCDEGEVSWTGDGTAAMVELDFASMYPGIGVVDKDDAWPVPPGGLEFDVSASKGTAVEVECAPCWR